MNILKPIIKPVFFSTTFTHASPGQMGYSRVDNPTRLNLEVELAQLEGSRFSLAFSSGSSALAAVFTLLKTGDVVLSHDQVYEGTSRMLRDIFNRFGVKNTHVDFNDLKLLKQSANKVTMMVCESITNPCLGRLNIHNISKIKIKKTILVVDNTIATPIFLKPLEEGADIVVHSLTKYIGGHHDVIAGAIMTNNKSLYKRLRDIQWRLGAIPSPHDCFLILRGMQTITLRMLSHQKNAQSVADFLSKHSRIKKVNFPGVSGIVSFWMKGDMKQTIKFLVKLKHIRIAHSFGGTQTTVLHPLSMMTFTLSNQERERQGITGNLVRISVGIEDLNLVIGDLQQALET